MVAASVPLVTGREITPGPSRGRGERGGCLTRASPGLLETECRTVEAPTRPVDALCRLRGCLAHSRAAYEKAGSGTLQALREADPELGEEDSTALADALRRVLESLPDGGRALVVGHSPTNEAAVLGLAGEIVEPISKGGGVLVVEEDGAVRVEKLD